MSGSSLFWVFFWITSCVSCRWIHWSVSLYVTKQTEENLQNCKVSRVFFCFPFWNLAACFLSWLQLSDLAIFISHLLQFWPLCLLFGLGLSVSRQIFFLDSLNFSFLLNATFWLVHGLIWSDEGRPFPGDTGSLIVLSKFIQISFHVPLRSLMMRNYLHCLPSAPCSFKGKLDY